MWSDVVVTVALGLAVVAAMATLIYIAIRTMYPKR